MIVISYNYIVQRLFFYEKTTAQKNIILNLQKRAQYLFLSPVKRRRENKISISALRGN